MEETLNNQFTPEIWQYIWQYQMDQVHQGLQKKIAKTLPYDDVSLFDGQIDFKYLSFYRSLLMKS